ncbi:MAG: J domain-containing protein [Desulfobacteraceae bacterium]|nr:J domain-containing protein [Desulfobacteraceae bacterium]MCF8094243.1 J domain-containing protein [Desulfobacteraceae bacterium]
MLTHYLILDLPPGSDDETIRQRYLEMVKKYPPESDPVMFRRITEAYNALCDERSRIRSELFGCLDMPDWENELFKLAQAAKTKRRRTGLKEMLEAAEKNKEI